MSDELDRAEALGRAKEVLDQIRAVLVEHGPSNNQKVAAIRRLMSTHLALEI